MGNSPNTAYHGLVDMGSNGIRFSITDLSPKTQRILPTIYQDRAAISLYDAQWSSGEKLPIPFQTIKQVIQALNRFKAICEDLNVPPSQIRIVATEATRAAQNSADFIEQIQTATGWTISLLPKEEEGRIGAYGVASSYSAVNGLVMDLGGGSTQITWLSTNAGEVTMSEKGSISMPYGAAALTQALSAADKKGAAARSAYRADVVRDLKNAVAELNIPPSFLKGTKKSKGLSLYLSGGGFRGWGFVLMNEHPIKPYPIPIINGFHVTTEAFHDTAMVQAAVRAAAAETTPEIFRVSQRRASQVPAVAFLVACLAEALPAINDVYFCQGGVREGTHFASLSPSTRALNPFTTATLAHAPPPASVTQLVALFRAATPSLSPSGPSPFTPELLTAFAHAMFAHASLPKDLTAGSALRSTTTGLFAGTHGVSHEERALLALLLCERYGGVGHISPTEQDFYGRVVQLLPEGMPWWCLYLGKVAAVVASVYPAGVVRTGGGRVELVVTAQWAKGKKGQEVLGVDFGFKGDGMGEWDEGFRKAVKGVEKAGKKKNWVEGKSGWRVDVTVGGEVLEG